MLTSTINSLQWHPDARLSFFYDSTLKRGASLVDPGTPPFRKPSLTGCLLEPSGQMRKCGGSFLFDGHLVLWRISIKWVFTIPLVILNVIQVRERWLSVLGVRESLYLRLDFLRRHEEGEVPAMIVEVDESGT